jgi:hypothetical protein
LDLLEIEVSTLDSRRINAFIGQVLQEKVKCLIGGIGNLKNDDFTLHIDGIEEERLLCLEAEDVLVVEFIELVLGNARLTGFESLLCRIVPRLILTDIITNWAVRLDDLGLTVLLFDALIHRTVTLGVLNSAVEGVELSKPAKLGQAVDWRKNAVKIITGFKFAILLLGEAAGAAEVGNA